MNFSYYVLKNYNDFDANFGSELWASELSSPKNKRTELKLFTFTSIVNFTPHTIHKITQVLMAI